jgi:hypothetical protein
MNLITGIVEDPVSTGSLKKIQEGKILKPEENCMNVNPPLISSKIIKKRVKENSDSDSGSDGGKKQPTPTSIGTIPSKKGLINEDDASSVIALKKKTDTSSSKPKKIKKSDIADKPKKIKKSDIADKPKKIKKSKITDNGDDAGNGSKEKLSINATVIPALTSKKIKKYGKINGNVSGGNNNGDGECVVNSNLNPNHHLLTEEMNEDIDDHDSVDDIVCYVCNSGEDGENILLCDLCNKGIHSFPLL